MIIFTVPKPFTGRFALIQKNAINSWLSLTPRPTVVLMGDEKGIDLFAEEKNIMRIKNIKKNSHNTPLLNDIFSQVQKKHADKVYMYVNTDVILLDSPIPVADYLGRQLETFLAIGRRFELKGEKETGLNDIRRMINKSQLVMKNNSWIDYFIFTKGIFDLMPEFALGKTFWDKWLVWNAINNKIPTVDISDNLKAVHQSHSYSLNPKVNIKTVWAGEEALENLRLAGGWSHGSTIGDTQFKLIQGELIRTKNKKSTYHPFDLVKPLWPLLLRIRLLRERFFSIMNEKGR